MGLNALTLGLEPEPSGRWIREVGGGRSTVTLQKGQPRPHSPGYGAWRPKPAGMGKCGGRRGSEAPGRIWEENAFFLSEFHFQGKSRLHGKVSLYAPYPHPEADCPASAWGPVTRLQAGPQEDTVREWLVREGRQSS